MNDSSEVKLHFLDYWRVIKVRWGLILLAFFLVMVTAGVTTYFLPREYFSKVTMEVKEDNSGPVQVLGSMGLQRSYNPQFVAKEFQVLQTTAILYPVIERLDLTKEFSLPGMPPLTPQQAFIRLKRAMSLQEIRNTSLIEIGVYHTNAQLAANIANTIAVVYQDKRASELTEGVRKGLAELREGVKQQQIEVEQLARTAAQIRAQESITDPDPESYSPQLGRDEQRMSLDEQNLNAQKSLVSKITVQLQEIEKIQPEALMGLLQTLEIQNPTVLKTLPLLQDANVEEQRLINTGLGENHHGIKALRAAQREHREVLSIELGTIRQTQATRLKIEQERLERLQAASDESAVRQIAQKTKTLTYIDAKSKYIQARKVMESAALTASAETIKLTVQQPTALIYNKAEKADAPAKPNVPAYMALAGLVGLVVGVGLAFFIEYLDTSVKTLDDVERFLQIPVLAVIPKDVSLLMQSPGDTADAEAYRILRANVEFNKPSRDANTVTLISGGPGEGKSTTLNNLAFTCAKGGYNVLVVDADLRRPSQHTIFDVPNTFGLTDYLQGKADLEEVVKTTRIDNLSFIPSGQLPSESVGILNSQRMMELMRKLKTQYDLVFFDSPPILGVSDGSVLASEVDMTIMVVQHRRFPRAMLQRVKQAVMNVGGRLIGVVLNNVDARHDEGYSYYNNYNDYYAPRPQAATTPEGNRPAPPAPRPPALAARPRDNSGDY
jgi:capsular exopolysaccharide synthesis family protein